MFENLSEFLSSWNLLVWENSMHGRGLWLQDVVGEPPVVMERQVGLGVLVEVMDQTLELCRVNVLGNKLEQDEIPIRWPWEKNSDLRLTMIRQDLFWRLISPLGCSRPSSGSVWTGWPAAAWGRGCGRIPRWEDWQRWWWGECTRPRGWNRSSRWECWLAECRGRTLSSRLHWDRSKWRRRRQLQL